MISNITRAEVPDSERASLHNSEVCFSGLLSGFTWLIGELKDILPILHPSSEESPLVKQPDFLGASHFDTTILPPDTDNSSIAGLRKPEFSSRQATEETSLTLGAVFRTETALSGFTREGPRSTA